jgi:flagellar biosynthesis protein FlhF
MELKTYQANSMAEALTKVKRELGREAVILHTRTLRRGGWFGFGGRTLVEITATCGVNVLHPAERRAIMGRESGGARSGRFAADHGSRRRPVAEGAAMSRPPVGAVEPPVTDDVTAFTSALRGEVGELRSMIRELLTRPAPGGAAPQMPDVPEELRSYYTGLIQNAVAEEIAGEVVAEARTRLAEWRERCPDNEADLRELIPEVLLESIERMLPPAEPVQLNADGAGKYVALVGPTGVGKTTTIAKLAAHFKLREQKRVGMITIDTYRIAAVDQLKAYAEILDVPLEIVLTPAEMSAALERMRDFDLVLIDTSGRSQKDAQRLAELKQFLDVAQQSGGVGGCRLEVHLVLSCTGHPDQLLDVAEKFSALGVERVVFTKVDEAVGLGVILNVVRRLNLHLSYLTNGQDVPDDIEVGHRRRVAQMMLNAGAAVGEQAPPAAATTIDYVAL